MELSNKTMSKEMKIKQEGLFIESKYSGFRAENMDQFLGYEAGQFDGASSTFDTVANWIEEDVKEGRFDSQRYVETLRRRARDTFIGDPQRFYPLLELLDLHAAIKPNAAAGEEGTE